MTMQTIEPPPSPRIVRGIMRITTDQYHKMIADGIIAQDASTELLDGVIVHKDRSNVGQDPMSHSPEQVLVVSLLSALASRINGPARHLKIQLPICIAPRNEPEPDASIVRGTPRDYADRLPGPADVYCVIEAAQSSLPTDVQDKLETYAAAGIPQYLIVNLIKNQVEVYEQPDSFGAYRSKSIAVKGHRVRVNLGNGEALEIDAAEILC